MYKDDAERCARNWTIEDNVKWTVVPEFDFEKEELCK